MNNKSKLLWDLPVRLTHWLIVVLVAFSWWTAEYDHVNWHASYDQLQWHTWSGYALLTLLLFRIYWGFFGSSTARFSQFLRGPKTVWRYTRQLLKRPGDPVIGHNPLGGWSALLLIALLLIQVSLGLFAEDVDGLASGPLAYKVSFDTGRWAAETHHDFFNLLLAFIVLHILAIFFYLIYKRNNLIGAMVTGRNPAVQASADYLAPWWRAAVGLALAAALVWWIVR